ncbi:MAG TPA: YfiR family protein [Candidatus Acidoferrales bacterium]|nr:YfiR family protein [Candidatus Acidoferrales bacterium]
MECLNLPGRRQPHCRFAGSTLVCRFATRRQERLGGRARRKVLWALLLASLGLATTASPAAGQPRRPSEYQVKAAFLYNFAKFVQWPPSAFEGPSAPLVICVAGENPFGTLLNEMITGKTINGHPLEVENRSETGDLRSCNVLFVGAAQTKRLPKILEILKDSSVLTVGEADGFAGQGGVVNFYLEQDRVRFEINVSAAARSRLKISSKLLALARIVGGDNREANN